jgi:hypothetical protein
MTMYHLMLPFSSGKFFPKNNMTVAPHPPYFPYLAPCDSSLFHQLKKKLKGCHSDTNEVMEAELHAVPNTLIEHGFQDAFRKWRKCWEWCIHTKGIYSEGDCGQ